MKQPLLKNKIKNKKGQVIGFLNLAKIAMIVFATIVVVGIAGLLIATSLRDAGIFTTDSREYNDTVSIVGNYSSGVTTYFRNVPTLFTIMFVVALIGFIGLIIYVVNRFGSRGGGGL